MFTHFVWRVGRFQQVCPCPVDGPSVGPLQTNELKGEKWTTHDSRLFLTEKNKTIFFFTKHNFDQRTTDREMAAESISAHGQPR